MAVEYTLDADDIVSARLLAIGIRPRLEFGLFAASVAAMLAWSVSPWRITVMPLLIGLTASLAAFRLMQIGKVKEAAMAAFRRNPVLRQPTTAVWDERGVTIQPAGFAAERIPWAQLRQLRENERVVLLLQGVGLSHAIPKRAFVNKAMLDALRAAARGHAHA
ncbi:MAG TPA: YcxB family protein [Steroidobacteraceae bacterium]|nr:YcxB family protein [Steroidobacteraceae bacterium]